MSIHHPTPTRSPAPLSDDVQAKLLAASLARTRANDNYMIEEDSDGHWIGGLLMALLFAAGAAALMFV